MVVEVVVVGVVVVVVLTGDFTNVFIHARKWVHLVMGAMSLWT